MLSRLTNILKSKPLAVSLFANTTKTVAADILTQTVIEQKNEIDLKRLAVFTTFGCGYLGGWQYFLFNKCFVRVEQFLALRRFSKLSQSVTLTFLDMGVHTPLMYYPAFYMIKGQIEGKEPSQSMVEYKNNFASDMRSICQIWIPAQMINFSLVPLYLRMPYITSISFAWTVILSMMHGASKKTCSDT